MCYNIAIKLCINAGVNTIKIELNVKNEIISLIKTKKFFSYISKTMIKDADLLRYSNSKNN